MNQTASRKPFGWLKPVLIASLGIAYGLFSAWAAIEYQAKRGPAEALPTPPVIKFWDFGTVVLPWYAVPASVCVRLQIQSFIARTGQLSTGVNEAPFYVACAVVGTIIAVTFFALFRLGKRAASRWRLPHRKGVAH